MSFKSLLLAVAAAAVTTGAYAAPALTPVFYGPTSILAGQTADIEFTLDGSLTAAHFIASITPAVGATAAPSSFALYSGATEVAAVGITGGLYSIDKAYTGLTIGNTYSLRLTAPVSGTFTIRSKYVGDGFSTTITAVPEPESVALALAGLGVVVGLSRRRTASV